MDERIAIAARVRATESGAAVGPWTIEVYPTLRCNLDCGFCDTTERHRPAVAERDAAWWCAVVDEAADLGARRILVLGGGEPLLAAATLPLMARAKARGLIGTLTTNGTRLDAAARDRLTTMGWDEVHVSVDGATAATHDALRGKNGAFARTITNVCHLRRVAGAPRLALHTVLTRKNVDELAALAHLAHALGAYRWELDALVAYRPEQQALALGPRERARLPARIAAAQALADRLGLETTLDRFGAPDAVDRGARTIAAGDGPVGPARAPCLRAWHHLVVDAAGVSAPCCVLSGTGDPVEAGALAGTWRGPALDAIRAGMREGRATARCAECSENILAHERSIRDRLPEATA